MSSTMSMFVLLVGVVACCWAHNQEKRFMPSLLRMASDEGKEPTPEREFYPSYLDQGLIQETRKRSFILPSYMSEHMKSKRRFIMPSYLRKLFENGEEILRKKNQQQRNV